MEFFILEWELQDAPTNKDNGADRLEQAVVDWTEAIRHDPTSADAHLERGNAYFAEDELDLAIEDYTMAIRLDPHPATAYYCRGLAYRERGDLNRSEADQVTAARLDPEFAND